MIEELKEAINTNEMGMEQIDVEKLVNWTDEECAEFDNNHHVQIIEFRNLIRNFRNLAQDYNTLYIQYDQIRALLSRGNVLGYIISCPKCKVTYNVKPDELNYNKEIQCQDCGEKYIQNNNIVGLYLREEIKNEENK